MSVYHALSLMLTFGVLIIMLLDKRK
ncbi:putative holin-like toxin [Rubeoparvulum massiliense]